jgi:predicted GTPase
MKRTKVIIMGAGGRDFHVFNTLYRDNPFYEVVCFTAAQIPFIDRRIYPKRLAGKLYEKGIPIYSEKELYPLIKKFRVDKVVFAYSDVSYEYISEREKVVRSAGADFILPDPWYTMLTSIKPVIAVCAVRTGAGKSPVSRKVLEILKKMNKKAVVIRHPMAYGNLSRQIVQRFAKEEDLRKYKCTIEEIEEYEPHIKRGNVVYAGADYEKILKKAEKEADVIVWDGGNNDTPFIKPDIYITVLDPYRAGDELNYFPGKINFLMANVLIVNKVDSAPKKGVDEVIKNAKKYNPKAYLIKGKLNIFVENSEIINNKEVLVIEDGPTTTHGNMKLGAGVLAAKKYNAKKLVDPRPYLSGSLIQTFNEYPDIGLLLPAVGYSAEQIKDLENTINKAKCDIVIIATPIDLGKRLKINKPYVRVRYEFEEIGEPKLENIINDLLPLYCS